MTPMRQPITFRSVAREDFGLLRDWHARAHVLEWWPEPPTDTELSRYLEDRAMQFHLALLGGEPFGFIQSYRPVDGHADGWWLDEHGPGVRGIDQFLANASQLGQGLGSRMVRAFAAMLFMDRTVTRIQADPDPQNARAIRCYEKAGFRRVKNVVTPDGPALLMYLDNVTPY